MKRKAKAGQDLNNEEDLKNKDALKMKTTLDNEENLRK